MITVIAVSNMVKNSNLYYINNGNNVVYAPVVDGKQLELYAETEDIAMLLGISWKYDKNAHFARFAIRMLGIQSVWG